MLRTSPVGATAQHSAGSAQPTAPKPGQPFRLERPSASGPTPTTSDMEAPAIRPPKVFEDLETRRQQIDQMISKAMKGEQFRAGELLVWQARVYAYSQQMDIFSKVVDRAVSALKTTLNTQL